MWEARRLQFKHCGGIHGCPASKGKKRKDNREQSKVRTQRGVCISMFISALLTTPRRYPFLWTDEWLDTTWYVPVTDYYPASRGKEHPCYNMDEP